MIRESSSVIGVTIRRPSSISTFINPPKKDPQKRSQKKALQLAFLSARWSEPTPGQRDDLDVARPDRSCSILRRAGKGSVPRVHPAPALHRRLPLQASGRGREFAFEKAFCSLDKANFTRASNEKQVKLAREA